MRLQVRHFNGRRLHTALRHQNLFLACNQRTGNIVQVQGFKLFKGQQTKRSQINAAACRMEPLHALPGFSRIGWTNVENKAAVHAPCHGIQVFEFLWNSLNQSLLQAGMPCMLQIHLFLQCLHAGIPGKQFSDALS